ncbi:potassium channel family protein [Saccharibacillus alkalitolerans]|uniref:Potassium channel family protein n=1 Tax=Saccharibacillus alkalitolerans TaxID=2705290 RepID=A0ABX0F957_9BACL|nr:potassium channel family protein [Saccharibacillus alkalitolerans]NGZ77496.1 potassium channel family protein [Saccharibacillus alkalitolerans]
MKKSVLVFECLMFVLVLVSLFLSFSDMQDLTALNWGIWLIFFIDYTVRLVRSENKWTYVKKHPLELIAIIPLDAVFRAARVVRLLRILRLIGIGSRYMPPVYKLLKTNGLDKVLIVALILLFIIPIPIVFLEPSIHSFTDALWWAVVTTTTVGYGDLSPETPVGRILAVVLMMVGIGIIGTLTSAITSFFSRKEANTHDKQVLEILNTIEQVDRLTEDDVELIQLYLKRKGSQSNGQ